MPRRARSWRKRWGLGQSARSDRTLLRWVQRQVAPKACVPFCRDLGAIGQQQVSVPGEVISPIAGKATTALSTQSRLQSGDEALAPLAAHVCDLLGPKWQQGRQIPGAVVERRFSRVACGGRISADACWAVSAGEKCFHPHSIAPSAGRGIDWPELSVVRVYRCSHCANVTAGRFRKSGRPSGSVRPTSCP